eukprot:scaffold38751_cov292-Skeletonema_marinoi.AAC.2
MPFSAASVMEKKSANFPCVGTIERQSNFIKLGSFCASPQNNVGISTLSSTTSNFTTIISFTTLPTHSLHIIWP